MKHFLPFSLIAMVLLHSTSLGQPKNHQPKKKVTLRLKTLNDYFPFTPPKTLKEWKTRRRHLKEQVLVATGLWPLPKKTPLNAVIHGQINRDGYTIQKVFFASYPGHYVTGNLYKPTGKKSKKKIPGVLCPHGHWRNGRFYQAGDSAVKKQIESGAEQTPEGARSPLQARCAQLARMGCVVFHYDMVGYADSQQIKHRQGFTDPDAVLWQQNFMGLQTWNSIRALDFLLSLPEVDPQRIGVTGASGGGTQTFMLCAVDDRPDVAFPAVMVSTAMQGGCICENCSYLRVGTGNIELAALFAPKPLGMTAANDWTKEIETKGYPQLKQLYRLYGAEDKVLAKAFLQFGHNYNQVSREVMYNWFNKHLGLGLPTPVTEEPYVPVPIEDLSVFDEKHSLPKDAIDAMALRDYLTKESKRQLRELLPNNANRLKKFRKTIETGLRVMMTGGLAEIKKVDTAILFAQKPNKVIILSAKTFPGFAKDTVVIWVSPNTKAHLKNKDKLKAKNQSATFLPIRVLGVDQPGPLQKVNSRYAGYTWGYNPTVLAYRVQQILNAVALARKSPKVKKVHLVGIGEAGPWVLMARALCGDAVDRTAADMNQFRFEEILSNQDEMMQPGALKYGGLPAFSALCAPHELFVYDTAGTDCQQWLRAAYKSAGVPGNVRIESDAVNTDEILTWLLR